MTLLEALENNKGNYIYVGSRVGFFYIGKDPELELFNQISESYKEELAEKIRQLEIEKDNFKKREKDIKKRIEAADARVKELTAKKGQGPKKIREKTDHDLTVACNSLARNISALANLEKRKVRCPKELTECKKEYKNWVNMLDREVLDVYERRIIEPYGNIIIVKGKEHGRFWTLNEYEKGMGDEECLYF